MKFKNISNSSHSLLEMAKIGNICDCEVAIYSNEGFIPHIHLNRLSDNAECCIRIDKAEYFPHNKNRKWFKLKSSEKDDFIKWINSSSDEFKVLNIDISVYRNICILWNQNNQDYKINVNMDIPDYNQLK